MRTRKRKGGANQPPAIPNGTPAIPNGTPATSNQDVYPFYFHMTDKQKMLAEVGDPFLVRTHLVKFNKTMKKLEDVEIDEATKAEKLWEMNEGR